MKKSGRYNKNPYTHYMVLHYSFIVATHKKPTDQQTNNKIYLFKLCKILYLNIQQMMIL